MLLHLDDLEFSGSRGGLIWLTVGDTAFPEKGWYDLPGVLLESWMPGLDSFFENHTDACELCFMDGPFKVRLSRAGERITAVCLEQNKVAIPETRIDLDAFRDSVQKGVRYYERMRYLSTR